MEKLKLPLVGVTSGSVQWTPAQDVSDVRVHPCLQPDKEEIQSSRLEKIYI